MPLFYLFSRMSRHASRPAAIFFWQGLSRVPLLTAVGLCPVTEVIDALPVRPEAFLPFSPRGRGPVSFHPLLTRPRELARAQPLAPFPSRWQDASS